MSSCPVWQEALDDHLLGCGDLGLAVLTRVKLGRHWTRTLPVVCSLQNVSPEAEKPRLADSFPEHRQGPQALFDGYLF